MAEEDDMMLYWVRANTAPELMHMINEAADEIQYGFRLHGTISAHQYKMARNYIIISNILRQRGDFIRNPRRAPYDAAPTVVVGTLNMFNRSLRHYGVNGFMVRFPNWVQPVTQSTHLLLLLLLLHLHFMSSFSSHLVRSRPVPL